MSNFLVALQLDLSPSEGFYYGQFPIEQKLQALSLHEEGYSTCSVAQTIDTGSHQLIDT